MPGASDVALGNVSLNFIIGRTLSPVIVGANTTAEQTLTVPGLQVGDFVLVQKPTSQAGLGIVGARVSAANTLAVTFINATALGITPTAAELYGIMVFRCSTFPTYPTGLE
jgi:hypothetical protein